MNYASLRSTWRCEELTEIVHVKYLISLIETLTAANDLIWINDCKPDFIKYNWRSKVFLLILLNSSSEALTKKLKNFLNQKLIQIFSRNQSKAPKRAFPEGFFFEPIFFWRLMKDVVHDKRIVSTILPCSHDAVGDVFSSITNDSTLHSVNWKLSKHNSFNQKIQSSSTTHLSYSCVVRHG